MKRTLLAGLFLTTMALFAPSTYACFCVRSEVPEALEFASAVFLGEVVEITEPRTTDETAPLPRRFFTIKFKVERSWKGVAFGSQEISVLSAQGRYGCFAYPPVSKGQKYLVYADAADGAPGWSIITICNRTTIVRPGTIGYFKFVDLIDPYDDMKQLDVVTQRSFNFDYGRSRKSTHPAKFKW